MSLLKKLCEIINHFKVMIKRVVEIKFIDQKGALEAEKEH